MHLPRNVSDRMEYIQKLFLDVEQTVEKIGDLNGIFDLLDKEAPEFRSVAYESASMVIGIRDLCNKKMLDSWEEFRQACSKKHTFHIDIGLGWAFAKTGISPADFLGPMKPVVKWMVFDGIGYYYGLFKGRNTIKNKIIPEGIEKESLDGFDEGLGRRLWYMAKGDVNALIPVLQDFNEARHSNLWRGVGIACGYVGGNNENDLVYLLHSSGLHKNQFSRGIMLAAISRNSSNSITEDVKLACRIVCNKTIEELNINESLMTDNFFYL
jgi:hypothetical protein